MRVNLTSKRRADPELSNMRKPISALLNISSLTPIAITLSLLPEKSWLHYRYELGDISSIKLCKMMTYCNQA